MATLKVENLTIGEDNPTYFIADIAANHDGDFEKAKELGWEEKPQWQIHQEQEAAETLASIPSLDDL